jgi:large subunit ribosomal protein L18
MLSIDKTQAHERRRLRIRNKVAGTAERPRLTVCKTARHLYAQVVDDDAGRTLAFVTTNTKAFKADTGRKSFANVAMAEKVGGEIAAKAKAAGVTRVVFDRAGFAYHGVVKAVAEAARKAGLQF